MKINAETVVLSSKNYTFENTLVFINGNENGLISKIEELITSRIKLKNDFEKILLDSKNFNKDSFLDQINNKNFFSNYKIICVINLNEGVLKFLLDLELKDLSILISAPEVKSGSKIKKFFDTHKKFYSISCYSLSENSRKNFINNFVSKNKINLSNDAYWYLFHNTSDKYQLLENELEKLLNFSGEEISVNEMNKLLSDSGGLKYDDLFFDCIGGNKNQIIVNSQKTIKTSADAYLMLKTIKNFSNILTSVSENKNGSNFIELTNRYLPKYLFMKKKDFEKLVEKINIDKLILINRLLQKTEIYLRRNDVGYLMIVQRFLLNYSKIIK